MPEDDDEGSISMSQSPFERLLGPAFAGLPDPVQAVHALREPLQASGRADIDVATNLLAQVLCRLAGLPASGRNVPVCVLFKPDGSGCEYWERRFGKRRYVSVLVADTARARLIEHFGPFDLLFRLKSRPGGLEWSLTGWRLGALPLPGWSTPRIECLEGADGDRFTFDIDVGFPVIGWVMHYRGWLAPKTISRTAAV